MGSNSGVKQVLDTSTLIDILRGEPQVTSRFRRSAPSDFLVSTISASELIAGAAQARDSHRELFAVDLLLRPLTQVSIDESTARCAGLLDVMLRKAGTPIGAADRLIAATALEHDAVIVASDTRDFQRVPFLVTENWRTR